MTLFEIGFYCILIVFGFLFINRKKINSIQRFFAVLLISILFFLLIIDTIFDKGFGYSTPIDLRINNKTKVSFTLFGILQNDSYCDNSTFVYSFGKLKLNQHTERTIEADCGKEFIIFAFDENETPVLIKKMNLENDEIVEIVSIAKLDESKMDLYMKYKNILAEFKAKELKIHLCKIGIIVFSVLTLFLIFRRKHATN